MLFFSQAEAAAVGAIFQRLFPGDELGPGAGEIGAPDYVDRALAGAYAEAGEAYRLGLAALDRVASDRYGAAFAACATAEQDTLLADLARSQLPGRWPVPQDALFGLFRSHLVEGLFADPAHGGNRDKLGWAFLHHPGVWFENSEEEALSPRASDKGGEIRALSDLRDASPSPLPHESSDTSVTAPPGDRPGDLSDAEAGYDPSAGIELPGGPVDVVIVGVGAVGGLIAPVLAHAGLRVVGLEAGPWRRQSDFRLDELGSTQYGRASMSAKFMSEVPRWRATERAAEREPVFGLGKMMNGVGGSVVHYGGWLRRFHPHHFRVRTHLIERWGDSALPPGCTVTDWPIGYDGLEPYYCQVEHTVGVAGDDANPFTPRSVPLPMPPLRLWGRKTRTEGHDLQAMIEYLRLLVGVLRAGLCVRSDLVAENLLLRQQLLVLHRPTQSRPRLRACDRLSWLLTRLVRRDWRRHLALARPDAVVSWHRQGWRLFWRWTSRPRCGRLRLSLEIRELIARMAGENPAWGSERIRGELLKLGIAVCKRSVQQCRRRGPARPPGRPANRVKRGAPYQSPPAALDGRPAHGPHGHLPHLVRPAVHRARPPRTPARQCHRAPDRRLGVAATHRRHRVGAPTPVPGARPGPGLRGRLRAAGQALGDRDGAHAGAGAVGERRRGTSDRHPLAGVPGSRDHPERAAPPVCAGRVCPLLQPAASPPHAWRGAPQPMPRSPTGPLCARPVLGSLHHSSERAA